MNAKNCPEQISLIKEYKLSINNFNNCNVGDLQCLIADEKGDWYDFYTNYFNETYYIDVYLIFTNYFNAIEQPVITEKLLNRLELFFDTIGASEIDNSINNSNELEEILNEDGFIFNITENGGGGELNDKEIEKIFKDYNIKYEIVSVNKLNNECGASGASANLIYFIANTVGAGIAYDALKFLVMSKMRFPSKLITSQQIDRFKFNMLRSAVADRVREDKKSLILIEMKQKEAYINFAFKANGKQIKVECNNDYKIINFKVFQENMSQNLKTGHH